MKTNNRDSYYTSEAFAEILMSFIDFTNVKTIADACVGGGNLLQAALAKKSNLICYGTDISDEVVTILRKSHPRWILDVCDFLDEQSRMHSFWGRTQFDLMVLNPPFTCRGSVIRAVSYKGEKYHVSTSMSFMVNALSCIKKGGIIYAIMPISTIYSQKDRKIWNEIFREYEVVVHHEAEHEVFGDCAPNVAIISIKRGKTQTPLFSFPHMTVSMKIEVMRGKKNMHYMSQRPGTKQLIHTTSLQRNKIVENLHVSDNVLKVKGPGVLIPRVGLPDPNKICLMPSSKECAISDCIILLKTTCAKDSRVLKNMILNDWKNFRTLYKGTGAKYITIERLKHYLSIK